MYFTSRKSFYTNKKLLKIFQGTITCPFFDSKRISEILQDKLKGRHINILDIGGGDGLFTSLLLKHLNSRDISIDELVCIDPVNWSKNYLDLNKELIDNIKIKFIQTKIQKFNTDSKFDLIIISHSLYGIIDELKKENNGEIISFIQKLLTFKKRGGIIVSILTSGSSQSYKFKNQALHYIFKEKIQDTTSEIFKSILSKTKINYITYSSTNFIILTWLLKQFLTGDKKYLEMWLSYFLRYNVQKLKASELNQVYNLLIKNTRVLRDKENLSNLKSINFNLEHSKIETVLLHETDVIVF